MRIRNISRWEFEQLLPEPFAAEVVIGDQVEWWAQRAGRILGTIAKDVAEPGWHYIMLERDAAGHFHICRLQRGIESLAAASLQLIDAMEITGSDDENVSIQESTVIANNAEAETNRQPCSEHGKSAPKAFGVNKER